MRILSRIWPPVVVFILAMIVLQMIVRGFAIPRFELPAPTDVASAMWEYRGDLALSLWTTTQAALIGFFASGVIGILLAVLLASWPLARRAFYPYTVFFQTVPIIAVAPMLMIWFDAGIHSVAICAFIVSVFPVIANTLTGLLSTDPALEDLFTLYGADPLDKLFKLRLPSAIPNIMTGLRIAAGLAVIGTVVGEFLVGLYGEAEGLGVRIVSVKKSGRTDEVFAAVLAASLLGLAMFAAVNLAARLLLRNWHASEKDS